MTTSSEIRSIVFLTPSLDDNSLGRTYSLWLLAQQLGWSCRVITFEGKSVWAPLAGTPFGDSCELIESTSRRERIRRVRQAAASTDVVVAVKPLPLSLGLALSARRGAGFPLVADIDDPDLEARLHRRPLWRSYGWRLRFFPFWMSVRNPRKLARRASIAVSNPTLQRTYGGEIVPHVREDLVDGAPHVRVNPVVAFVGTPRAHKGIDLIRDAVAQVSDLGFTLVVTATPPEDAKPWETWVGSVPFAEGMKIVASSDIVIVPSSRNQNAVGQLPVKLVDAMLLGRGVIVSDVDPMPWAVSEEDAVVPPDDVDAIVERLKRLAEPAARTAVGGQMRERALELFAVEAVAPTFAGVCKRARAL